MYKMKKTHVYSTIFILIISLSAVGMSHSGWRDEVKITGTAKMGCWKSCIRIWKTLDGAFTDPETGDDLTEPNRTHIAIATNFSTKFLLTIYVKNCGSTPLSDIVVTDTVKNTVTYSAYQASKGSVDIDLPSQDGFQQETLIWTINELQPGDTESLLIYIKTLQNPSGKYEPTSGDEGDRQEIEINEGAEVTATSIFNGLSTSTSDITLVIGDNGIPDDGIGLIESPTLPYSTPKAEDSYP